MTKQNDFYEEAYIFRKNFRLYEQITKDKLKGWAIHMQMVYGGNFLADLSGRDLVLFAEENGVKIGERNIKKKTF